eukprot:5503614-Prymnesium_polylepis.1
MFVAATSSTPVATSPIEGAAEGSASNSLPAPRGLASNPPMTADIDAFGAADTANCTDDIHTRAVVN